MDQNSVVLEISSDENVDWNDHDGGGIADGVDDQNWLSGLLEEVSKENCGNDSDEVVLVSEVSPSKKTKSKSSLVDLDDDCVVLDYDPSKPVEVRNDNPSSGDDDSDDIRVVGEKGQVACRDYPHSRHLCIKFPFSTTPKQNHCEQCYCYVCDSLAPCVYWGNGSASLDHCHATDKDDFWAQERKYAKNGTKVIKPVLKVTEPDATLSMDHLQRPTLASVPPHNQIQRIGSIDPYNTSATFRPPNIINQHQSPIFASRTKLHPDLVSQYMARKNGTRGHQNHIHRPVFKRPGSVGVATTANRHSSGSYRGNIGNAHRQQQNHRYVGSGQPNSVNTSVSYPLQSQNDTSSTVNPQFDQPLPPLPQFSNQLLPNSQSQVNSNPFPDSLLYQTRMVPTPSQPQIAASWQPNHMVAAQPSYPISSQTQVDNPSNPLSGHTQNFPQENQVQNPTIDPGFKDDDLSWSPSLHPATTALEGTDLTNESSLGAVPSSLADYQYDWIFENQPNEPGFIEDPGTYYGWNEISTDSSFIDTGPIFDF